MKYTYLHVEPDTLDSGRPLAFGDEIDLDKEAVEANQRLVDEGRLVKKTKTPQEDK